MAFYGPNGQLYYTYPVDIYGTPIIPSHLGNPQSQWGSQSWLAQAQLAQQPRRHQLVPAASQTNQAPSVHIFVIGTGNTNTMNAIFQQGCLNPRGTHAVPSSPCDPSGGSLASGVHPWIANR